MSIVDEIYDKIYQFGLDKFGKRPTYIRVTREDMIKIKQLSMDLMMSCVVVNFSKKDFYKICGLISTSDDAEKTEVY